MTYGEFLVANLPQVHGMVDGMTYDEPYDHAKGRYQRFTESPYNDPGKGLYECIEEWIVENFFPA